MTRVSERAKRNSSRSGGIRGGGAWGVSPGAIYVWRSPGPGGMRRSPTLVSEEEKNSCCGIQPEWTTQADYRADFWGGGDNKHTVRVTRRHVTLDTRGTLAFQPSVGIKEQGRRGGFSSVFTDVHVISHEVLPPPQPEFHWSLLTLAVVLQTEPAGQVEDLGVGQVQDWNQRHGRAGLPQERLQTFFKPWWVELEGEGGGGH